MSALDPEITARLAILQSLDDAIAFRLARLDSPCDSCRPGQVCDDHAQDAELVAGYQERHGSVLKEMLSGLDPAEVDQAMREWDGIPLTVLALSLVMNARLRELAADGPVVMHLDGRPVVLELEGLALKEHLLLPEDGNSENEQI